MLLDSRALSRVLHYKSNLMTPQGGPHCIPLTCATRDALIEYCWVGLCALRLDAD